MLKTKIKFARNAIRFDHQIEKEIVQKKKATILNQIFNEFHIEDEKWSNIPVEEPKMLAAGKLHKCVPLGEFINFVPPTVSARKPLTSETKADKNAKVELFVNKSHDDHGNALPQIKHSKTSISHHVSFDLGKPMFRQKEILNSNPSANPRRNSSANLSANSIELMTPLTSSPSLLNHSPNIPSLPSSSPISPIEISSDLSNNNTSNIISLTVETPQDILSEIDINMCTVFKLIKLFSQSKTDDLHELIYPKSESGEPCYNPNGIYCIKLFISGKWRKVRVTHTVPVDANGNSLVAFSSNQFELWPFLLSKAVYYAFELSGYNNLIPSASGNNVINPELIRFAFHALTGWLPGQIKNIENYFVNENSMEQQQLNSLEVNKLISEIQNGGAPNIKENEEPGEPHYPIFSDPIANALNAKLNNESDDKASTDECAKPKVNANDIKLTKHQYDKLFAIRNRENDAAIDIINSRNNRIQRINELLNQRYNEFFVVLLPTLGKVYPILAVSANETSNDTKLDSLSNIKFLVKWNISVPSVDFIDPKVKEDKYTKLVRKLPLNISVDCEYLSLKQLVELKAILLPIEQFQNRKFNVPILHTWLPHSTKDDHGSHGGKNDKNDKAAANKHVEESFAKPPGPFPFNLIRINLSEKHREEGHENIYISVFLNEDKIVQNDHLMNNHIVVLEQISFNNENDGNEKIKFKKEFNFNLIENIPMDKFTFVIPLSMINNKNLVCGDQLLFSLYIKSLSSITASFGCNFPIQVGSIDKVCKGLGLNLITFEGDTKSIPLGVTEHLLFRLPLEHVNKMISDGSSIASSTSMYEESTEMSEIEFNELIDNKSNSRKFIPFLTTSTHDSNDISNIYLVKRNASNSDELIPYQNGSCLEYDFEDNNLLVGSYCLHDNQVQLSSHSWTLNVIFENPTFQCSLLPFVTNLETMRFGGSYLPNSKAQICRDSIIVDKHSFPLAIRLTLDEINKNSVDMVPPTIDVKKLKLNCQLIEKSSMKVLRELNGNGEVLCTDIFLPDCGSSNFVKEEVNKKGQKNVKAPIENIEVILTCNLVIDDNDSASNAILKSRFPYVFIGDHGHFSTSPPGSAGSGHGNSHSKTDPIKSAKAAPSPLKDREILFAWHIDILAGRVQGTGHDITELERHAAMQSSWQVSDAHRHQKAEKVGLLMRSFRSPDSFPPLSKEAAIKIISETLQATNCDSEDIIEILTLSQNPETCEIIKSRSDQRKNIKNNSNLNEDNYKAYADSALNQLNKMNESWKSRVLVETDTVIENSKSAKNDIAEKWKAREAHRSLIISLNDGVKREIETIQKNELAEKNLLAAKNSKVPAKNPSSSANANTRSQSIRQIKT